MKRPTTKTELMTLIDEEWAALQDAITRADAGWIATTDPDELALIELVAHVSAWERSLIALLTGQSRATAVGMDETSYANADIDQINAHISSWAAGRAYSEAFAQAQATHTELIGVLNRLSWEDLGKPYAHFQPGSARDEPAIDSVLGNTSEHYAEHREYLERASAATG